LKYLAESKSLKRLFFQTDRSVAPERLISFRT